MNRRSLILATAAALAMAPMAHAQSGGTMAQVKESGALRIGVASAEPWFYKDPMSEEWTGVGVAISSYAAGSSGIDGLLVIRPDGKVQIHTGGGNLGTESFSDTSRAAMEALDTPWEQAEMVWGDTSKHLPWSCIQGGSMTTHAHTRANHAAAHDARRKLQEIAARDLGGAFPARQR